ncbi:MAG: 1,4-dihydroxy-2-naphthoate octaprenyltransferase [Candidatus Eiseniibacteriota bacterium]|nr:MAG: 1,4-dihydroxy-2-naphthoate octaprenyltransferase [Candidatus Eisenbacteria bacterium]
MKKILLLAEELRAPFLTASIVPVLLGAAVAWSETGEFSLSLFLLALVAGVCLHAGTNVVNDYFDHKSGNDEINVEYVRPFTGGSRLIQKGLLSPRTVLVEALVLFAVGGAIGIYLAVVRGPVILVLGVIGGLCGFFYTAPPVNIAARGVGELTVGLNFGVLMTLGSYYIQAGRFSTGAFLASLPVAILIADVLFINEFPDFTADKAVGKNHLVVRLGKERAVWGYLALTLSAYLAVLIPVMTRAIPPYCLLALVTVPIAMKAINTAILNYADSAKLAPANAATIMLHLFIGVLVAAGFILDRIFSLMR